MQHKRNEFDFRGGGKYTTKGDQFDPRGEKVPSLRKAKCTTNRTNIACGGKMAAFRSESEMHHTQNQVDTREENAPRNYPI